MSTAYVIWRVARLIQDNTESIGQSLRSGHWGCWMIVFIGEPGTWPAWIDTQMPKDLYPKKEQGMLLCEAQLQQAL